MTVSSAQRAADAGQRNVAGDHLGPDGFDYDRIAGVHGNPHVTRAFLREVEAMAGRLGTRPEYLLAVMSFESGESFRPDVRNAAGSGATGLIQFMPATARELGTSTDALARMSSVEQLEYVERYFNRRSDPGDLRTLEGVYTTVLYGSPRPDPGSTLFSRGTSAYRMNAPLDTNGDGRITAGEATSFVRRKIDGDAPPPSNDPPANDPPSGDPSGDGRRYTVRSGDMLSGIASRHDTSVSRLMSLNPQIRNPDLIYAGQSIRLPGGGDGPAPDRPGNGRYTIRSGDTLSGIASRYDTSVSRLMALNPQIHDPDRIYAGQSLRVPGGGGDAPAPSRSYTIRSGDTLSGIAARSGTSVGALMAANPQIRDSDLIYAGQTLRIPGGGGDPAPSSDAPRSYTVRSGDTLSGIASRFDTSVSRLLSLNPQIRDPDLIYAGQRLRVSGSPGSPDGNPPVDPPSDPPGNGDVHSYRPYTVYSTGHRPSFAVSDASQLQPHHDYQSVVRNGQRLEVRDVVLHRNGQSQTSQAVPAPLQGTVIHAGPMGTAGNAVGIRDANGRVAWIFHMSSIDVRVGQRVDYGQDLGNQGSTGNSTGPHVHIEAAPQVIDRWVNDLLDGRFDGRNR